MTTDQLLQALLQGDSLSHAMRTLLHMSIAASTEMDQTTAKTALGRVVQIDSIKTRVESAHGFRAWN